MVLVDVHCHTFNADDLPVRGFVQHVAIRSRVPAWVVARLLDLLVQGRAPGYAADLVRLNRYLGLQGEVEEEAVAPARALEPLTPAEFDQEVTTDLRRLSESEPDLIEALTASLGDTVVSESVVTTRTAAGDFLE